MPCDALRIAAAVLGRRGRHGFTDAVHHEPRGFVGDADHALDLLRAHALLRCSHEMRAENPLVQADLGALEHGADRHGKLLAAVVALVQASAVLLATKGGSVLRMAMRANRTMRPKRLFEMSASGVRVVVNRIGDIELHGGRPFVYLP